jgi:error-prone DNA polymerase
MSERFVSDSDALREARSGDRFAIAGLILIRQRPGTASGVVFVTLEDEFGIANLVVWPAVFEQYRQIVMGARLLAAKGRVQREGIVIHLVVEQLWDWSADLDGISDLDAHFELRSGRGDQVRSSTPDPRDEPKPAPRKPVTPQEPYDRGRTHLDRPVIKIASRDFH